MPTLILPPRYTPDSNALWKAAIDAGWETERLQGWRIPAGFIMEENLVLYGEPLFAAVVADQLHLALLEPPFPWTAELPEVYRRRDVQFSALGEARQLRDPRFIKPADDKCFPAKVYESGSRLPADDVLPDSTPVLIAEPVSWEVEYRCFVLERQVLTSSIYLRNGGLAQEQDGTWDAPDSEASEALELAGTVLSDAAVRFPAAAVLDVGRIAGRGWAVVESNAAWGSGIYGCDPAAVLRVIQRACIKRNKLNEDDRAWVVERKPGRGS